MSYQSEVLADSPVGFWKMTEASSPLANSGSNSTTLTTQQGSPTFQDLQLLPSDPGKTPNLPSSAVVGGPTGSAYSPATYGASGAMTIEAAIQPTTASISGTFAMIVTKANAAGTAYEWDFRLHSGKLEFVVFGNNLGSGGDTVLGSTTLVAGTKYLVAASYDRAGNFMRVYINGVLDGAVTPTSTVVPSASGPVWVGGRADQTTSFTFLGEMGWIAFYGSGLTTARLLAHYNASQSTPATTVVWANRPPARVQPRWSRGRSFQGPLAAGVAPPVQLFNSWVSRGRMVRPPPGIFRRGASVRGGLAFGLPPFVNFVQRGGPKWYPLGIGRRGRNFSPGFLASPLLGRGFPLQPLRSPGSRLGLGGAPVRRGNSFNVPLKQPLPPSGVLLVASSGTPMSLGLAFVTIQVRPDGVHAVGGAPFYAEPEILGVDRAGNWTAFVLPVGQFSNPAMFYLITEWFYDGRTKSYKARIPNGSGPSVLLKDVLI